VKAIQVQKLGGPEVLELADLPMPEPKAGQVRLRVQAVGLNFADILNVNGEYLTRARTPFVPGMEMAGVIDALGEGVTGLEPNLKVGQLVAALGPGAFAEYAVVHAAAVFPIPANLNAREAAALPVSYYTAYFALRTLGQAKTGETVLIEAGAGALGTATIQLAKEMGLKIIALASKDDKLELTRSLGADHAFLNTGDYRDLVLEATGGKGVDIMCSIVGGPGFQDRLTMMASRGRVMVIGNASRESANLTPTALMTKNVSVIGVWLTPLVSDAAAMLEASQFIGPLIASGKVKPIVGRAFKLEDAGEAFTFMLSRQNTGKVVIEP
jgi:NADPH:quinone reductase